MRAPIALAIWIAAVPTPDAPAWTSAHRPLVSPPCTTSASHAVRNTSGIAGRVLGRDRRRGSAAPGGSGSRRARRSTRPTRSPSRGRRSPSSSRAAPTAATVPAYSRPGISTSRRTGSGYPPMRCNVSARLHALCVTRTRISSGPGTGSATSASVRTSGPPYDGMVTARTPSASRGASARIQPGRSVGCGASGVGASAACVFGVALGSDGTTGRAAMNTRSR